MNEFKKIKKQQEKQLENQKAEPLHKVSITDTKENFELKLDDFELKGVTGYEIKSSVNEITELTVKLIVSKSHLLTN